MWWTFIFLKLFVFPFIITKNDGQMFSLFYENAIISADDPQMTKMDAKPADFNFKAFFIDFDKNAKIHKTGYKVGK